MSSTAHIMASTAHAAQYNSDTCLWEPELTLEAARQLLGSFHCPCLIVLLPDATCDFHLGSTHLGSVQELVLRGQGMDDDTPFVWLDSAAATGVTRLTLESVKLRAGGLPALQEVAITDWEDDEDEGVRPSYITSSQGITKWTHTGSCSDYKDPQAVSELAAQPLEVLHVSSLRLHSSTVFGSLTALRVRGEIMGWNTFGMQTFSQEHAMPALPYHQTTQMHASICSNMQGRPMLMLAHHPDGCHAPSCTRYTSTPAHQPPMRCCCCLPYRY